MFWRIAPYVVGFAFGWLATRLWVGLDYDYLDVWIRLLAVAAVFLGGLGIVLKWRGIALRWRGIDSSPRERPPGEAPDGDRPPGRGRGTPGHERGR